jgi:predicted nucleic acid-binding protein
VADLIVDTDILIDTARGVPDALAFFARHPQGTSVGVGTVTQLELLVGCRNKQEQRLTERFLQRFEIVKLNEAISDAAISLVLQYRLSHGLLLADALIAATALSLNIPLATNNQRDYRFIQQLVLLPYP